MRTVQTTRNKPFWRLSFPPKGHKIQECSDSCFGYQHCPAVNTVCEGLFPNFPSTQSRTSTTRFQGHRRHMSAFILVPECVLKHPSLVPSLCKSSFIRLYTAFFIKKCGRWIWFRYGIWSPICQKYRVIRAFKMDTLSDSSQKTGFRFDLVTPWENCLLMHLYFVRNS